MGEEPNHTTARKPEIIACPSFPVVLKAQQTLISRYLRGFSYFSSLVWVKHSRAGRVTQVRYSISQNFFSLFELMF